MSKLLKSKLFLGVMLVAVLFVGAVAVNATPAAAIDCSISSTLRVGSVGTEVSCLQTHLGILADGKFGPMTAAAVKAWQASKGLAADGVFGAMSRAAMSTSAGVLPAGCMSTAGYSSTTGAKCDSAVSTTLPAGCMSTSGYSSTTGAKCDGGSTSTGPLTGGAGSITVSAKSTYSNEEIIAGDEDAKVLAFEVEADDDSDVDVTSVKVELEGGDFGVADGNSDRIEDYMDSVSIWMNGEKVGEADAEDFTENNNIYTKTISLDGAVVRAGETEVFVVAVTAASNLDSGDINDDAFGVDVLNVRFEDAEGVVTTEDTDGDALDRTFDFDDLSTSGDLELKLTESSSNPDAQAIEVSETSSTNDVLMLAFKLKAEGSEMLVDSMEFDVSSSGDTDGVDEIVEEFVLLNGSDELDSVSAPAGATGQIVFTDLDFTIGEGDTEDFTVVAKIKEIATGSGAGAAFDQGDNVTVSFTAANLDDTTNTDVEDENGDTVIATDRSGSVTGDAQTFFSDGIVVTETSTQDSASKCEVVVVDGANNDRADCTMKFSIMAIGQEVFVAKTFTNAQFDIEESDGTTHLSLVTLSTTDNDASEETNSFRIPEGSTADFTLSSSSAINFDAQVRAVLHAVRWGSDDAGGQDDNSYSSNMGINGNFKTGYVTIAD